MGDIVDLEQPTKGTVISVGGQIPNGLCMDLYNNNVKVLGTCPTDIDSAEDRSKFSALCDANGIVQPAWRTLSTLQEVKSFVAEVGYPILARPSYVLSGGGMQVVFDDAGLEQYLGSDSVISADFPVVVSKFYENCFEADLDAIAQNGKVLCYGIADHVELAGTHSGDAHMVLPPHRLSQETQDKIKVIGDKLAKALNISGPFNSQFIITPEGDALVIECNVRASRSLPFMSKTLRHDMVEIMGKVLLGKDMSHVRPVDTSKLGYVGVKVPQFSWTRLRGVDPRCGVEMASTGEVATFGLTVEEAFLKSVNSTHIKFPRKTVMCSAIQEDHVAGMVDLCRDVVDMGYQVFATETLAEALEERRINCISSTTREAQQMLEKKDADFLISIPSRRTYDHTYETGDHYNLRRAAVDYSIPLMTELENARMLVRALRETEAFTMHAWGELPHTQAQA